MTSHRDSVVKHVRKIHNKQGLIYQWDEYSWQQFRQMNDDLPTTFPTLPLKVKTFGNRCSRVLPMEEEVHAASSAKSKKDIKSSSSCKVPAAPKLNAQMPAVSVRRIDGPSTSSQVTDKENVQPPTAVEPSPLVIVEKRMGLRRRLKRYERNLTDVERVAQDLRDDIRRTRGQLAELGDISVTQS